MCPRPIDELPLTAAVGADPVRLAVVVGGEEALDRAEAGRLDVDGARRPAERLDVRDGVDRGVPGDAVGMRLEEGKRLVGERGVLDPGVGEGLEHAAVQGRVGRVVDDRARVLPLEVDRVDAAELPQLVEDRVRPVRAGVELEAQRGVDRQEGAEPRRGRRVAEAPGGDERDGSRARVRRRRRASVPPDGARDRALRSRTPSGGSPRSRGGPGASGNSATVPRWREKLSSVHSPARGRTAPRACWASWRPPSYVTSSPRPSSPAPDSRITVVLRRKSARAGYSWPSSPYRSTTSGRSRTRSYSAIRARRTRPRSRRRDRRSRRSGRG